MPGVGRAQADDMAPDAPAAPAFRLIDSGGRLRTTYQRQTHSGADKMSLSLEPEVKLGFHADTELFFKPRLEVSPTGDYKEAYNQQYERSNGSKVERFNDYSRAELRELYVKTKAGDADLTLGKQQIFWGTADGLRVLDVVDPLDLTDFIMADPVDSRIPRWTANYQRSFDFGDLQLLWIPDNTFNTYSAEPDWYLLTSPKLVPGPPPPGVNVIQNPATRPGGNALKNADYGLRLTKTIKGWDLSFNYLYHYDPDLIVRSRFADIGGMPTVIVDPTYKRTQLIGGTFSVASGNFVYRGEFGFNTARYVLSHDPAFDGVEKRHEFTYVFGVDYSGLNDTFISGQLFQSILSGSKGQLVRDKVDSTLTLNVTRNFVNETWRIEALFLHSLNEHDSALRARLKHVFDDKTSLYLQYDNYAGDRNGQFGQFRDRDRVMLYLDRYF